MNQLKLSKTGKLIATIVYISLIVFLAWPFHMGSPLNWLKVILIVGFLAYNAILHGKSVLDDKFISTNINDDYLPHYMLSSFMTISILIGTFVSIYISLNDIVSDIALLYLILSICVGGIIFITDLVAIISIIVCNINRTIKDTGGITHVVLKLPFANILFEQPKQEKSDKKVKM